MLARYIVPVLATLITPAFAADIPSQWEHAWPETDFSRILVDPSEIFSGGPLRDGIPAITGPNMIAVSAEDKIGAREPVMSIEMDGHQARSTC